jgi:tetratricopeptide (TPR) repeat protein
MTKRFGARGGALAAALLGLFGAAPALAIDAAEARGKAETAIRTADSDTGSIQEAIDKAKHVTETPEKRIVAGELLMRTGDYDRAIYVLSQVLELHRRGQVPEPSYADALFLIAETYFKDNQHLAAARHYRELVDKGMQPPYDSYVGRSLSRLVDVSIRTQHTDVLDYVFTKLAQLPASDASGSLQYARGKAYIARGDLSSARGALDTVAHNSEWIHQASYLQGVVAMKEALAKAPPVAATPAPATSGAAASAGATPPPAAATSGGPQAAERFAAAIELFHKVTQLPADTEAHRHVIDLAWMAIGRLFYETENYLDAAEAYSHVDRGSPEFGDMLYELAWVYVRLGDNQRAQRALEVLSVTAPGSLHLADGSLLRADLMLRSGMFERALELYESVRQEFDPMRQKVDSFLTNTTDPTVYYDRLVEEQLDDDRSGIPSVVLTWVREAAEDDRVFGVIDDVTRSRDLIKKSRELVRKLTAVLSSPTRARAFPELKAGLEKSLGLLNKVSLARRTLAMGLDSVSDAQQPGETGQIRLQRRALMQRLGWLPVTEGDFLKRESSGERQWNTVSQKLQGLTIEADKLQAMVNALRRVLSDADKNGMTNDVAARQRLSAELEANERDLKTYRERIASYREAVEMGRVQIGFGDQRYVEDDDVRARFRELLAREVQLAASGQADGDTVAYARTIDSVLAKADQVEQRVEGMRRDMEAKVRTGAEELQRQVDAEAENIRVYADRLDALDQNARLLVGEVAMKNFGLVRDRLKSIVLRADVGIVQQAWETREEQRFRVRDLQRERAREEQNLNDELREVLDDAGGQQ